MANQTIYTVGGTVQAGGGIYIKRKADDELLQLCKQGEFAFILSSRQVGKSSLMVRTAQQLESESICSVMIDLSAIGVRLTQDEWYLGILNEIYSALNLETNVFTWWSQYSQLGPAQRLTNFFRDVLLKEVKQRIVLFFDEIDSTLSIPFSDDFYIALRAVYNARSTTPDFKRLSFVLVGVAAPGDLISDNKRTPFNIGRRVEINDFTLEEAKPLAQGLGSEAEAVLSWIFQHTGGHPYLTQRLCAYLASSKESINEQSVKSAVDKLFTGEQGKQDNNLQFVRDMLSKRSPDATRVLLIYREIRSGKNVSDDERSVAKAHLKLSGIVRSEHGVLRVRNKIYENVFNLRWVNDSIPKNVTKIVAFSLGFISFILLSIFIYDFVIGNLSSQYVDKFYKSHAASDKLEYLARMFDLRGILPNSDYDSRARDLFFSLSASDQQALFNDSSPAIKKEYLAAVVKGLFVTMANVEGGQDSTILLQIMRDALTSIDTNLYVEIDLWLQARNASTSQEALEKYGKAIELNGDNPATRYERAAIEIEMELFEEALQDLNTAMALSQKLSTEAAEREMSTPSPLPTTTRVLSTTTLTTLASPSVTEAAPSLVASETITKAPNGTSVTLTLVPGETIIPEENPGTIEIPESPSLQVSYKSNFFSRAYIRSAIELLIQKNLQNPNFRSLLDEKKYPELATNGLLPAVNELTATSSVAALNEPTSTRISSAYTCTDVLGCVKIDSDQPVHIAFWGVLSGDSSSLGEDSNRGVEIAIDDKGGKILGHDILLTTEDAQCTAEGGAAVAAKLATDTSLAGLIGSSCSTETIGGIATITNAGLTTISPSNVRPALTDPNRGPDYAGYLRTIYDDSLQGQVVAEFAYNVLGIRRAATLDDGSAYAVALQQVFADEFAALGGEIVAQEAVAQDATDMRPVLTSIAAAGPEFLYYPVFSAAGGFITAQVREIPGLELVKIAGSDALFSADFLTRAGPNVEGMYLSSPDFSAYAGDYAGFMEKYQSKYRSSAVSGLFHAHAYDAANILFAAIEKVAVVDIDGVIYLPRQALRDAIYATKDFPGVTGRLSCSPFGDCGVNIISIYQIVNSDPDSWNPTDPTNPNPQKIYPLVAQ